jgi:tetratricopeptide (TPR) repeat protein
MKRNETMKKYWFTLLALTTISFGLARAPEPPSLKFTATYGFGSSAFDTLVRDSESETASPLKPSFEAWLEAAYTKNPKAQLEGYKTLAAALKARGAAYAALKDVPSKVAMERDTGAWLHRMTKSVIPKFSLDRGFEFTNTVKLGERQCLLQGVLIASLLQKMGFNAGITMIWRSMTGVVSNLGHAATLMRLSDGKLLIVDASEPEPFATQQGIFTWNLSAKTYQFLTPKYDAGSNITGFDRASTSDITVLPYSYVRSQFYFYRGERVPGGFVNKPLTPAGKARSERFLQRAITLEPQNPLAQYVLGHVYRSDGKTDLATAQYKKGYALYQKFGFIPDGVRAAYNGIKP